MKKDFIPVCIVLIFSFQAFSQTKLPEIKLYGYKHSSIHGVARSKTMDETGNEARKDQTRGYNYLLYLVIAKTQKITIVDAWISGRRFKVKTEKVKNTPVQKIGLTANNYPDTTILVPATTEAVVLFYPTEEIKAPATSSRFISRLTRHSELVVGYFWKGNKYFTSLKAIKELKPDVLQ